MLDEELSASMSENLSSVLYDTEDKESDLFEKTLFAIPLELQRLNRISRRWVVKCHVDFNQDGKVGVVIETAPTRPPKWSVAGVDTFLTAIARVTRPLGVLIYGVILEYDKPPAFLLGDPPLQRRTCYDLKQYPKSVDYQESIKHLAQSSAI